MRFPIRCDPNIWSSLPSCRLEKIWTSSTPNSDTESNNYMLHHFKTQAGCFLVSLGVLFGATGFAQTMNTNQMEVATYGGGCFWCLEAVFQRIPGVKSVTSGYAGGNTANPSYEEVCTGGTGHAEVIQLQFDPQKISYEKLLDFFWDAHDPTTLNRQDHDVGTQYRSIILYSNEAQKAAAEKSKTEAQKRFKGKIVTEIVPLKAFYSAEDYHQNYFNNHSNKPYCSINILPKVEKLEKKLKELKK
jgi:peptide-methionine (S)-S-oxide reductase